MYYSLVVVAGILSWCISPVMGGEPIPTLGDQLASMTAASRDKIPGETKAILGKALETLEASGITKKAPTVGQVLPDGNFLDVNGKVVSLYSVIGTGSAIITFYRGGWCPYCNVQLRAYQQHLGAIEALGAKLVAITPEKPENALSTREKNAIAFPAPSDEGNTYARKLGLVFKLDNDMKKVYQGFKIDLAANQGNETWELPLAATFVIDSTRKIRFAFVNTDYKKRAEPTILVDELRKIQP